MMPTLYVICDITLLPAPLLHRITLGRGSIPAAIRLSWLSESLTFRVTSQGIFCPRKGRRPLSKPPHFLHSSTEKSQMQLITDFHMHYLNASAESDVGSLIQIQKPDRISQESTYLRAVEYVSVCVRKLKLLFSFVAFNVHFMHWFYTDVAKSNKSNTSSKIIYFYQNVPSACVSGCGVQRRMLSSVSSIKKNRSVAVMILACFCIISNTLCLFILSIHHGSFVLPMCACIWSFSVLIHSVQTCVIDLLLG